MNDRHEIKFEAPSPHAPQTCISHLFLLGPVAWAAAEPLTTRRGTAQLLLH